MNLRRLLTKGPLVIRLSSPELLLGWPQAEGISARSAEALRREALIPSNQTSASYHVTCS